ncbi:MAG: hypothetical protein EAX91_07340 [Candidatus Lokiarchaeota archaeon]|nr:hypothetical protein [Candidatus Lokiarchaeota archaeon]
MRILVFLHGTCIMHRNALGLSRMQIVRQVIENTDESISDFASYIPIGRAVKKLTSWQNQGAEISYLSSHLTIENMKKDEMVLKKYNFPNGTIFYRQNEEDWNLQIEKAKPDLIIEDDCESIGGKYQMTFPNLKPEFQSNITSIVTKEFAGIDHLPDDIDKLKDFAAEL